MTRAACLVCSSVVVRWQEKGIGELRDRIDGLEAENGALVAELERCRPIVEAATAAQAGTQPVAMLEELARVRRALKTKSAMCDALTAELGAWQRDGRTRAPNVNVPADVLDPEGPARSQRMVSAYKQTGSISRKDSLVHC